MQRLDPAMPLLCAALLCATLLSGCGSAGGARSAAPTPEAFELNLGLAQGYIQRGDYEIALDKLRKAEALNPKSADVHTLYGVLYERINRPEKAEMHYAKAVELAPEGGMMLNNYGAWICRSGDPARADQWFRKALDDPFYKTPIAALSNAGKCALQAGDLAAAEGYFRRALDIDGNHPDSLVEMATLSLNKGDLLRARAFWQRRESLPIKQPDLLELAIRIETALGDENAVKRYRQRLQDEFPQYRPSTPDKLPPP